MAKTKLDGLSASKAEEMLEGLGRIKVPKSSDVLAERLKREILSDAYEPGAMLPTERDLVTTTGLSRGSVREALRILETQGLVVTRAGRYGGTTVATPSDDHLVSHINLYARGRSLPLSALAEVRLALEPLVASLAAERRTEEDLEALRAIATRIERAAENDVDAFLVENVNWHDALAAASHNDLLRALAISVSGLMFEASRLAEFTTPEIRQRVCIVHRRILEAIEARDVEGVRRRVERDVQAYGRILEARMAASSGAELADEG